MYTEQENKKLKKIRHFEGNLEDFKTFWKEQEEKTKKEKK
jgi:hypothetical protein